MFMREYLKNSKIQSLSINKINKINFKVLGRQ